jgi:5-carboxymethyl-2-hydroxymuconate isomerase
MPHLTFEYTDNLGESADIPGLLAKSNAVLIAQDGLFPTGGIRSRAIGHTQCCIADGSHPDDAFVHAHLRIGAGRSEAQKAAVGEALFAMIKAHFAAAFATRGLALSLELTEFSEAGTYKHNNLHARYAKP